MRTYVISYRSASRAACVDVQSGAHIFEAACRHFRTFPGSRLAYFREI